MDRAPRSFLAEKFLAAFFKKRWGGGARPLLASRRTRNPLCIKKRRRGRENLPGEGFHTGNPRRGFPDAALLRCISKSAYLAVICSKWATPGMLSPCWLEVVDIRAPVAQKRIFCSFPSRSWLKI